MRVYKVTGFTKYGGGLAFVAANNAKKAIELVMEDTAWKDWLGATTDCMRGVYSTRKKAQVLANYTYIE